MRASRYIEFTQAFVLNKEELEKISTFINQYLKIIELRAICHDGIERSFINIDELSKYENTPKKLIHSIIMSARSNDFQESLLLRFENKPKKNTYFYVESDEECILKISEMLEDRLISMRPWYHRISKLNSLLLVLVPYWTFALIIPLIHAGLRGKITLPQTWNIPNIVWIFGALFGLGLTVLAGLIDKLKQTLFPMGTFSIGQGVKRHNDKEFIRTTIVIAFLVSTVSGVIVSLIM